MKKRSSYAQTNEDDDMIMRFTNDKVQTEEREDDDSYGEEDNVIDELDEESEEAKSKTSKNTKAKKG